MPGFWRVYARLSTRSRRYTCAPLLFFVLSLCATSQAAEKRLDLPAQPLGAALITLATEADVSIGLSGITLAGKTARPLHSADNFDEALTYLLAGSGLGFEKIDQSTYRIFELIPSKTAAADKNFVPLQLPLLEEITITARKRAESLQAAALSAAVVKSRALADYGARSASDAASLAAGLSATQQSPGGNKFFVRGLSDGAYTGNTQSAVGIYIDETRAVFNAPDPNIQLVDVERVEVIRGPQGTLYGAGSIAGLVRIITKAPVFGKLESEVSADASLTDGSSESGGIQAILNVPLAENFAVRGVAYSRRDGGYIDNSRLNEKDVNDVDTSGARLAARLQLSQDWTVGAGLFWQTLRAHDTQYYNRAMPHFSRANFIHEPSLNEFLDSNFTVNGDLGWAELVSSTAWIAQDTEQTLDASLALPALIGRPPAPTSFEKNGRYRTINHETRLVSPPNPYLQWMAGAFYSRRRETAISRLDLIGSTPSGIFYSKNRRDSGTEMALFGEITYAFNNRLSLTGGLRGYRGVLSAIANNSDVIDVGPTEAVGKNTKMGVTPKATLAFRVTPQNMVYAKASQGFRLGGINIDSRIANPTAPRPGRLTVRNFDSDTLWNFEIGSKSTLLDQKLSLNVAAFYAVWNNIQADLARINGLLYTTNIGRVHNAGFELETTFVANEHFHGFANVAWSNPRLTERSALIAAVTNNRLPVVPKISATLAGQYQTEIAPDYTGYINVKFDIVGSARLTNDANAMATTSQYEVFKTRVGVQHDGWKVSLYVDNIFNASANTYAFGNPFSFGRIAQITPLRPRTVGLTATWSH